MFGKTILNMSFTGGPVTVSGSPGGTGGSASPGGVAGGGSVVLSGSKISGQGGQITIRGGTNYGGSYIGQPETVFTVFNEDTGTWMRWVHKTEKAELKLGNNWVVLKPAGRASIHPLDLGSFVDTKGKEDLDEIRAQYEKHIKRTPWLQKLRDEYDVLLEKHKLFDAIKGDDDAKV